MDMNCGLRNCDGSGKRVEGGGEEGGSATGGVLVTKVAGEHVLNKPPCQVLTKGQSWG